MKHYVTVKIAENFTLHNYLLKLSTYTYAYIFIRYLYICMQLLYNRYFFSVNVWMHEYSCLLVHWWWFSWVISAFIFYWILLLAKDECLILFVCSCCFFLLILPSFVMVWIKKTWFCLSRSSWNFYFLK